MAMLHVSPGSCLRYSYAMYTMQTPLMFIIKFQVFSRGFPGLPKHLPGVSIGEPDQFYTNHVLQNHCLETARPTGYPRISPPRISPIWEISFANKPSLRHIRGNHNWYCNVSGFFHMDI